MRNQGVPPQAGSGLLERLWSYVNAGSDACLKGTPMIPLHRDTVREIAEFVDDRLGLPGSPPKAICGYPLPGWMLDRVSFDERKGEPDGWIVSLKRDRYSWTFDKRCFMVMARSDIGPLEAWDEALRIALREDAREAERASAIEARSDATGTGAAEGESATGEAGDARPDPINPGCKEGGNS